MVQALLEYSRVERHGDPFKPVDLNTVFEEVCEDMQVTFEETNTEITVDTLPEVQCDAAQLRQVFQNLLDNAITYSGDEPPQITVSATQNGTSVKSRSTTKGLVSIPTNKSVSSSDSTPAKNTPKRNWACHL